MTTRSPWFRLLARSLIGVMLANPLASMAASLSVDAAAGGTTRIGAAGNGAFVGHFLRFFAFFWRDKRLENAKGFVF